MNGKYKCVVEEIFKSEATLNESLQRFDVLCGNGIIDMILNQNLKLNMSLYKLFTQIKEVITASNALLERFAGIIEKDGKITDAFDGYLSILDKYFEYIEYYYISISFYVLEKSKNEFFAEYISECESNLNDTVESFLIMPVQRPPRYRLLLETLLKHMDQSDTEELEKVRKHITETDQAISKCDFKINSIQSSSIINSFQSSINDFNPFNNVNNRLYIYSTNVVKFSRRYNNKRLIIMFSDGLLVCEIGKVNMLKYDVNKFYRTGEYLIRPVPDNPPFINAFDVLHKKKSFRCNASSLEDKHHIVNSFNEVLKISMLNYEDLLKEKYSPVWIPNSLSPNCGQCNVKFNLFQKKHHCRWCGKCICNECSKLRSMLPSISDSEEIVCETCFKEIKDIYRSRA